MWKLVFFVLSKQIYCPPEKSILDNFAEKGDHQENGKNSEKLPGA